MNSNLAYQEYPKEERIDGKFVLMSPCPTINHKRISNNISHIFTAYLKGRPCEPIEDGFYLHLSEKNLFIPDFMIVCDPKKVKKNGVHGAPDLVVEVLSPSTAKNDRFWKKAAYEKAGVREYWIVDPNNKTIEQYFLREGQFIPNELYTLFSAEDFQEMTPEEREAVVTEFRCSLFDDLTIQVADIFDRVP